MLGHNIAVTFASKCRHFASDADGSRLGDTSNFIRKFEGTSDTHTMFASENCRPANGHESRIYSAESRLQHANQIR